MEISAAVAKVKLRPVLGQERFKILLHVARQRALLEVPVLFGFCRTAQLGRVEVELLARRFDHAGFRPNLIAHVVGEVVKHRKPRLCGVYVHRQKAAVARSVAQELGIVGGSEEYALPRPRFNVPVVCRTVAVRLLGDEVLDRFDLGFTQCGKLRDLDDPEALQFLVGFFPRDIRQRVREPFPAEPPDKIALAAALLSYHYQDVIEFHARLPHAPHRRRKGLARDRPDIRRVLSAHVVDKQGFCAGNAVPRQPVEVVDNGVVDVLAGDQHPCVVDVAL